SQANYLNGQGIVTSLNFDGWKSWGNRNAIYPTSTDPKDAFRVCRRMFNWVGNTLILSHWSKIDNPANRRLIESIVTSA
ncbi:phage tail sheath family protein, partial [Escherichia coli]|nr:phage tail sheath family protein [Escherichia coli]